MPRAISPNAPAQRLFSFTRVNPSLGNADSRPSPACWSRNGCPRSASVSSTGTTAVPATCACAVAHRWRVSFTGTTAVPPPSCHRTIPDRHHHAGRRRSKGTCRTLPQTPHSLAVAGSHACRTFIPMSTVVRSSPPRTMATSCINDPRKCEGARSSGFSESTALSRRAANSPRSAMGRGGLQCALRRANHSRGHQIWGPSRSASARVRQGCDHRTCPSGRTCRGSVLSLTPMPAPDREWLISSLESSISIHTNVGRSVSQRCLEGCVRAPPSTKSGPCCASAVHCFTPVPQETRPPTRSGALHRRVLPDPRPTAPPGTHRQKTAPLVRELQPAPKAVTEERSGRPGSLQPGATS